MNLMNDPIPNQNDIELNTEKAGGVAGKVDQDQIVAETYIQVNNSAPTENAALTLDIDPSEYTPEELSDLIQTIMKSASIIGDGTLKLAYYKKGSIKLFLSGSPKDIVELQRLINSKELTQIEGHNITEIQETTSEEDAKISLIKQVKAGEKNRSSADLSGADLSSANLDGTNLSGADLREANLIRAYLFRANLSEANLNRANLNEANLIRANLIRANLNEANLIRADLNRAYLTGANLSWANLDGANLSDARLFMANLSRANLDGANVSRARLFAANLSGANLSGANLSEAQLDGANLSWANLENTNLENATVFKAILGNNPGIDEDLKTTLIQKGAIFEDSPGDRSSVLTPV